MSRALRWVLSLILVSTGCAVADTRCVPPPRVASAPIVDPTIKPPIAKDLVAARPRPLTKHEATATLATLAPVTTKATTVLTRTAPTAPLVTKRPRPRKTSEAVAPARAPAVAPAPSAPALGSVFGPVLGPVAPAPPPTPAPARAPIAAPPPLPSRDATPWLTGERAAMVFAIAALAVGTLAVPLLLRRAPSFGRAPMRFGAYLLLIVRRFFRR